MTKEQLISELLKELENNPDLPLINYRKENGYKVVLGEGDLNAKVLFIGEAPGEEEAKSGRPFVGAAGRVLDELLISIGLSRNEVYITNIVSDRPQENRDPTPEEVAIYSYYATRLIEIIDPQLIVTLGRFSMSWVGVRFGHPVMKISKDHGRVFHEMGRWGHKYFLPLYHPAVALYNNSQKETLVNDFHIILDILDVIHES